MCKKTDLKKLHKLLDKKIEKITKNPVVYEGTSYTLNAELRMFDDGKAEVAIQAQHIKLAKEKSINNALSKAHELGHFLCWKDEYSWPTNAFNILMEDLETNELLENTPKKIKKIKEILKEEDRILILEDEIIAWDKAEEILREVKFNCWCCFYELRDEDLNSYRYKLSLL